MRIESSCVVCGGVVLTRVCEFSRPEDALCSGDCTGVFWSDEAAYRPVPDAVLGTEGGFLVERTYLSNPFFQRGRSYNFLSSG